MEVMSRNHAQEVRSLLHKNRVLTLEAEGLRETARRVQLQLKVNMYCTTLPSDPQATCRLPGMEQQSYFLNSKDIPDSVHYNLWQERGEPGFNLQYIYNLWQGKEWVLTCNLYGL